MQLSLLVAVSDNGVIGRNNQLLWHLPDDLKKFKSLTMGHPMIMGRKTFDSIGRPLPGRTSIVLTRGGKLAAEGVLTADSLDEAIQLAKTVDTREAFIIGGGEIYRQALEKGIVDKMYLTRVHTEVEGDTYFEIPDETRWEVQAQTYHPIDDRHALAYDFIELTSVKNLN